MKKTVLSRILPLLALVLLSGCILVDDFGPVWEEAKPDACLGKIAESLYYAEFDRDPSSEITEDIARGWTLNGEHFLLLKKHAHDKGGRLYRFDVHAGIFERYRLNPTMRETFERDYPNAPVSLERDTVTIKTLDDKTKALLSEIAHKPEYWEFEDKILYNTMLNPSCRFEDRDFKKMAEEDKPHPAKPERFKHAK